MVLFPDIIYWKSETTKDFFITKCRNLTVSYVWNSCFIRLKQLFHTPETVVSYVWNSSFIRSKHWISPFPKCKQRRPNLFLPSCATECFERRNRIKESPHRKPQKSDPQVHLSDFLLGNPLPFRHKPLSLHSVLRTSEPFRGVAQSG